MLARWQTTVICGTSQLLCHFWQIRLPCYTSYAWNWHWSANGNVLAVHCSCWCFAACCCFSFIVIAMWMWSIILWWSDGRVSILMNALRNSEAKVVPHILANKNCRALSVSCSLLVAPQQTQVAIKHESIQGEQSCSIVLLMGQLCSFFGRLLLLWLLLLLLLRIPPKFWSCIRQTQEMTSRLISICQGNQSPVK